MPETLCAAWSYRGLYRFDTASGMLELDIEIPKDGSVGKASQNGLKSGVEFEIKLPIYSPYHLGFYQLLSINNMELVHDSFEFFVSVCEAKDTGVKNHLWAQVAGITLGSDSGWQKFVPHPPEWFQSKVGEASEYSTTYTVYTYYHIQFVNIS